MLRGFLNDINGGLEVMSFSVDSLLRTCQCFNTLSAIGPISAQFLLYPLSAIGPISAQLVFSLNNSSVRSAGAVSGEKTQIPMMLCDKTGSRFPVLRPG